MKKGNGAVTFLITMLFVVVIAMALYIVYDKYNGNKAVNDTDISQDTVQEQEQSKEQLNEKVEVTVTKEEMHSYLKIFTAVNKDFKIGNADDMRNFAAIYIIKNYDAVEKTSGSYYVEISKEEVSRIMKKYFGVENYNLTNYTGDLFYDIEVKENTVLISWNAIGLGWEGMEQNMDIKYVDDKIIVTAKLISNVSGEPAGTMKFTLKIDGQNYYIEKIEHIK